MKPREIGRIIKRLREQRGWTQVELARRAHLSQSYIAKLERPDYKMMPALDAAIRLAAAFGMDIDQLVKISTKRRRT